MASDLQLAWLDRYLVCWNATQAARDVGYKWPNKKGPELKLLLADEIKARIEERAMTADEILSRIADHARGDLSKYILSDGEFDIESLKADDMGHLLKKYKKVKKRTISKDGREYETEYTEAELYPADGALEKLMKHRGLYGPDLGDKERPIEIKVTLSDD